MFIFSIIMTALLSLTMIGFGFLFVKNPPKEINSVFGYRTPMSSKNMDTWNFAHTYSGKVWIRSGIATLVLSLVLVFALQGLENYNHVALLLVSAQLAVLLLVIPLTEVALRKTFDKNGRRKQA